MEVLIPTHRRDLVATPARRRRHQRLRATAISRLDTAPSPVQPTHEQIALRAYEIYQQRDSSGGDSTSDWLEAERELLFAAATLSAIAEPLETTAIEVAES
jgi:hypothetical protein